MDTKLLDTKDISNYTTHVNSAAEALRQGELVAFPTETVYGIAVNAQMAGAVASLYDVKNRPREKEFAYLISGLGDIRDLVEHIPFYAQVLMREFWPGPLTIVFSSAGRRDVGVRFPGHKVAQDLIMGAGVPLLATSANVSGKPPATDAQKVLEYFGGRLAIILDDGPSDLQTPSTVVKVTQDSCVILREGAIREEQITNCLSVRLER